MDNRSLDNHPFFTTPWRARLDTGVPWEKAHQQRHWVRTLGENRITWVWGFRQSGVTTFLSLWLLSEILRGSGCYPLFVAHNQNMAKRVMGLVKDNCPTDVSVRTMTVFCDSTKTRTILSNPHPFTHVVFDLVPHFKHLIIEEVTQNTNNRKTKMVFANTGPLFEKRPTPNTVAFQQRFNRASYKGETHDEASLVITIQQAMKNERACGFSFPSPYGLLGGEKSCPAD